MNGTRVAVDAPPTFRLTTAIAPPKISDSAGAELAQFTALANGAEAITLGCVATPVPGWVEDMRPAVEGRTVALAGASAAIASGVPIDARPDGKGAFELRSVNDLEGPVIGVAKTFVGFDAAAHVDTCFATCIGQSCRDAVAAARLEGSSPPPAPGLGLRAVTWGVHHPRPFATGAAAAIVFAAALAVVFRRRPRTTMHPRK